MMQIPPEHIAPRLVAPERFEAIEELLEKLGQSGALPVADQPAVLDALIEREAVLSSGIGGGLAIPHAQSDRVSEVLVAFGFSPAGLAFAALDGLPVHFVFLFVLPRTGFDALSQATNLLAHPKLEAIRACTTAEEMAAILNADL